MKRTVTVPIFERKVHFVDNATEAYNLWDSLLTVKQQVEADREHDPERPEFGWTDVAGKCVVMGVFDNNIRTASHESLHAAQYVLTYTGVTFDNSNDEVLARLQDWIFGEWLRLMGGTKRYRLIKPT